MEKIERENRKVLRMAVEASPMSVFSDAEVLVGVEGEPKIMND